MPEQPTLTRAEQDEILLTLYKIAQRVAAEWVSAQKRDDIVHDFTLHCLRALRGGTWVSPELSLDRFVEIAILGRKWKDKRAGLRRSIRDAKFLQMLDTAPREWMSQELEAEENRLEDFAARVRRELPQRAVRAHLLLRDHGKTYKEVARKLHVSPATVHEAVKTVHDRFRAELPSAGIQPPGSTRGGRPAASRARCRTPGR